jgi:hypothetical protein
VLNRDLVVRSCDAERRYAMLASNSIVCVGRRGERQHTRCSTRNPTLERDANVMMLISTITSKHSPLTSPSYVPTI